MNAAHGPRSMPSNHRLGELGAKIIPAAAVVGVAGIGIGVAMGWLDIGGSKEHFFRSYLMAFMVACSICLGALFFIILQHCVKAGWSVTIRRLAEGIASNLIWLWIAFIPVVIGMKWGNLYAWTTPGDDPILLHKAPYLNETFWLIRAAFYFLLWGFLAKFFVGNSVKQDSTGDINLTIRMQRLAPVAIGLLFITQAFAAIDWMMSLDPHWFSTMFGVYFFAASSCGFYATLIIVMYMVQRSGRLTNEITPEHYQDAGKLLFAFGIVFWAYIAFSQYMLIWYANIPEETPWYLARQLGGWTNLSLLLLFGHFALPFVLLISRHPKRVPHTVAILAGWMLLMHIADIYWLTMPHVPGAVHYIGEHVFLINDQSITPFSALGQAIAHPDGEIAQIIRSLPEYKPGDLDVQFHPSVMDLAMIVGMLSLLVAGTAVRLSGCSLLPERDPRLKESLSFENI